MLLPQPPMDMVVDKTAEFYITLFLAIVLAAALIFTLLHWRSSKRPIALLLLLAGGSMTVFEPMVDTVGACWFAANSWIAFNSWGRPIPVWLVEAYFFYFGIASALVWLALRKGMTSTQIWISFVLAMLGNFAFETVLLMFEPYAYYGNQPLRIGQFAAWWAPVNGLIPIVLGAVVFRFEDYFRGWHVLTIVPLGLSVSAGVNAVIGWPSWTAINNDFPVWFTQICGVATFLLAFAILRVVCDFVASDARAQASPAVDSTALA